MGSWIDEETAACGLGDAPLNRRLGPMLAAMGERPGQSLPTAFQDWANTKAAYRRRLCRGQRPPDDLWVSESYAGGLPTYSRRLS